MIVLRTEHKLTPDIKKKVAVFCNIDIDSVIESRDVSTIYKVPIEMQKEKLDEITLNHFGIKPGVKPELTAWKDFLKRIEKPKHIVNIAVVGKYVELQDAYKSIHEALIHAGAANKAKVNINYIHSEKLNSDNISEKLQNFDGILIAPGFGHRGIDGKLLAVNYARTKNISFFGICLGMQSAVIEFAKNVLKYEDANSIEMDRSTKHPVINLMEEQKLVTEKGGTMRLGAYQCKITKNSLAHKAYNSLKVSERHRHRYEFNNDYLKELEKEGMISTGVNPQTGLVEIIEIPSHKWFVGVQFHPEYKSTVINPHPLFVSFIKSTIKA
jgi:CTP synthase